MMKKLFFISFTLLFVTINLAQEGFNYKAIIYDNGSALQNQKEKNIIKNSQNRIRYMSLIHKQLYKGNNLSNIETKTYFNKLIDEIISSYGINRAHIKQKIDIENMLLNMDTAISLGLIVNELVKICF